MKKRQLANRLHVGVLLGLGLMAQPLFAQGTNVEASKSSSEEATPALATISVVGSRRVDRSDSQSPVPVDSIEMKKAATEGPQFDLAQALQYTVPSFNSSRQTGADGADLVDSAALRGLGSDQTLVLVNGKRRHTTALVNLFGARNRGNTGTDLNAIPLLAIERVDVLRDGAAAQYGSDAIAGVMNIALKRSKGCETVAGYGKYTRGDGENLTGSAYCGIGFGNKGVVGITAEYTDRGRSDRSEPFDNPRTIGDSAVINRTLYVNGDTPLGDSALFYFTGGYQDRNASSAAFARDAVDDIPSRNSLAMYPNGFVPFIDGDIVDRYATLGARGDIGEWRADLSTTYGYNEFFYNIRNTLNASIANLDFVNGGRGLSPSQFDAGGFSFQQNTTNLDFSRFFDGFANGINVAFGAEYRRESYEIVAGEAGSYIDADGAGGGNAGSQGFPGFQPGDETDSSRNSWAGYGDLEVDFNDQLTTTFALRFEDYSDFGNTLDGKAALAYRASDTVVLRGSASTGFRAPSLQQRFFSSTFTDFISGEPVDVLLARNGGVVAEAAGIPALTEETSTGFTLGATFNPTDAVSLTLDAYRIEIDDRIVLSGRFGADDESIGDILTALQVGEAQFFINSVDTSTTGIDLTAHHKAELRDGVLDTFLAFNYSRTEVDSIHAPPALVGREDTLLDERERLFLEQGGPRSKAILGFDYTTGPWNGVVKFIYFGGQTLGTFSGPPVPNLRYEPRSSADVSLSYRFSEKSSVTLGMANVFDTFPSRQNADETDNGHVFDSVQFGLNGASWFARYALAF